MSAHQTPRTPARDTIADLAARYIYRNGPATEFELYMALDFGSASNKRGEKLQRAICSGWLREAADNKLECSPIARAHYDSLNNVKKQEEEAPIRQIAAVRQLPSVLTRPPLSKKNIPNRRGLRLDIPEWSVQPAGFSQKSVSGGEV